MTSRRDFIQSVPALGTAFALGSLPLGEAAAAATAPQPLEGHFHPKGKAPSIHTIEALKRSSANLPFADARDFEELKKGFIAPMPDLVIKADAGHDAVDMQRFQFLNEIRGGAIPREYIPAVERGILEAMENGVIAGYPMVDVKVTLIDGQYHEVDSSEMAFKICGSIAFKEAAAKGAPKLLEPIMDVEVVVPEEYMGDVIGDLSSRRGRIGGMFQRSDARVVAASVPLSEMFGYSTRLRSITQGRAVYSMQFSRYEEMPQQMAEQIVAKVKGS